MKIFVDAYLLTKENQGTKTYITQLYKAFAALYSEVKIILGITEYSYEIQQEWLCCSNVEIYVYKTQNRWKRMWKEIPNYLEKNRIDFAHFQYIIPFRKAKNCKYIVTLHDVLFLEYKKDFPFFYRISRKILFGFSAKKTDILLTVSHYSKEKITKYFDIKPQKIHIVPNAVNQVFFENYSKENAQQYIENKYNINNYILYVSRIEPRKNQQLLVKLFRENYHTTTTKYQLVFIGKNSLHNETIQKELAKTEENIQLKIHFLDQVNQTDLLQFYRAAQFFVYPSLSEGFGIPPLEAAATKIPVLCSNTTAMQDFLFFEPMFCSPNSKQFAQYFTELCAGKQRNTKEIASLISQKYSWHSSAATLWKIINTQHL